MNLKEAEEICAQMGMEQHRNPTNKQRAAKWVIFDEKIRPKYSSDDAVPPHLEPDFMEGWKSLPYSQTEID